MSSANAMVAPTEKIVVDPTYGALYICTTVAVTSLLFCKDIERLTRAILTMRSLMNTANQMFWCQTVYTYMVKGFDNPTSRNWNPWGITASSFISAFMILMVQGFYAWRLWLINHLIPKGISSLAAFIFNIICGAASDVFIAGSFVFLLLRSNSLINRLVLFSIRTGLFTSTFAIGSLILRTVNSKVDAKIFFPIATGLYANSMVALLNERKALRRDAQQVSSMSTFYDGWEHSGTGLGNHTSARSALDTHVTTHCNERSEHISIVVSGDGESGDYNSSATEEAKFARSKAR
ncbi:hypothetical protein BD410DRAFT_802645 [Rickenella mellea]|uniref:DUF6534 domain-containing protein n=1 Tax=Rickenella mellea TaxID=50990 RepID=A0A4Y7Q7Y2_9AGAM|nr:hypothetical protein BD410DRAFT_802645 [Rickenella mellea]